MTGRLVMTTLTVRADTPAPAQGDHPVKRCTECAFLALPPESITWAGHCMMRTRDLKEQVGTEDG